MITTVEILGVELNVEWSFKITSRGYAGRAPSLEQPGEPPEPAEFELEVEAVWHGEDAPRLELPEWLKIIVESYLYNDDDVYRFAQECESESESESEGESDQEPD